LNLGLLVGDGFLAKVAEKVKEHEFYLVINVLTLTLTLIER